MITLHLFSCEHGSLLIFDEKDTLTQEILMDEQHMFMHARVDVDARNTQEAVWRILEDKTMDLPDDVIEILDWHAVKTLDLIHQGQKEPFHYLSGFSLN